MKKYQLIILYVVFTQLYYISAFNFESLMNNNMLKVTPEETGLVLDYD